MSPFLLAVKAGGSGRAGWRRGLVVGGAERVRGGGAARGASPGGAARGEERRGPATRVPSGALRKEGSTGLAPEEIPPGAGPHNADATRARPTAATAAGTLAALCARTPTPPTAKREYADAHCATRAGPRGSASPLLGPPRVVESRTGVAPRSDTPCCTMSFFDQPWTRYAVWYACLKAAPGALVC